MRGNDREEDSGRELFKTLEGVGQEGTLDQREEHRQEALRNYVTSACIFSPGAMTVMKMGTYIAHLSCNM